MNLRKRFSDAWWRLRHDETGAVCVGCGLEVVDGLLAVDLAAGGGILCGDDGLYVSTSVLDPISPDACNGIVRRGNGLYSPCPKALAFGIDTGSPQQGAVGAVTAGVGPSTNTYGFTSDAIVIDNPLCCAVKGKITIRAGGLFLAANDGFYGDAHLEVKINTDPYGVFPSNTMVFENQSGGVLRTGFNGLQDDNYLAIAAGGSVTYQAQILVNVHEGNGTLSGTIGFEFNYFLAQDCTCT